MGVGARLGLGVAGGRIALGGPTLSCWARDGAGIGGIVGRLGADFAFFITKGGASGGAFRFAVVRDLGVGLAYCGITAFAVVSGFILGFFLGVALAITGIFFLGLARDLAAGLATRGGGALARRARGLSTGLGADFPAVRGAGAVRRAVRRLGLRNLMPAGPVPGRRRMIRWPGL